MWVSERDDSGRPITAEIKNWNNKRMEGIYHSFIEGEIKRQIDLFGKRGGDINSFNLEADNSFMIVEPACNDNIPDIVGDISPRLFYCSSCHHTVQHKGGRLEYDPWRCPVCKKYTMKQLQMIYTCECGYAQPIKRPYVKGAFDLLYKPNQNPYKMFYQDKKVERTAEFAMTCPSCNSRLVPDNAESNRNYKPFSLRVINLVDKKSGDFFDKGEEAQKIVIAKWFGKLDQNQYKDIVDNVEIAFSDMLRSDEQRKDAEKTVRGMIDAGFVSADMFEEAVNNILATKSQSGGVERFASECDDVFSKKKKDDLQLYSQFVGSFSYKLMQYDTIKYAKQVFTLQDAIDKQIELELIEDAGEVLNMNKRLGIKNMQVSCDIEIITCTYGYTRKSSDPANNQNHNCRLKLNAFAKDGDAHLVYGSKLETEGILFEIDQAKIIEWLFDNKVIEEAQMPDLEDELSVKRWFAENVKGDTISAFGEIEDSERITKNVFGLLHSISHSFIKTAGEISGLSGNSLTEIIIAETASVFIYAQTSQAIPLGALSGMVENNYAHFLRKAYNDSRSCVFDPICSNRDDTRCSACLIIPEISCNHFNNELGRKYLYTISAMDEPMIGFWDM